MLRNILTVFIVAAVAAHFAEAKLMEGIMVFADAWGWTPAQVKLANWFLTVFVGLGGAANIRFNTWDIITKWWGSTPTPKQVVDAAAQEAIAAGVPKELVHAARVENAAVIAEQIKAMTPPPTDAATLDSLKHL